MEGIDGGGGADELSIDAVAEEVEEEPPEEIIVAGTRTPKPNERGTSPGRDLANFKEDHALLDGVTSAHSMEKQIKIQMKMQMQIPRKDSMLHAKRPGLFDINNPERFPFLPFEADAVVAPAQATGASPLADQDDFMWTKKREDHYSSSASKPKMQGLGFDVRRADAAQTRSLNLSQLNRGQEPHDRLRLPDNIVRFLQVPENARTLEEHCNVLISVESLLAGKSKSSAFDLDNGNYSVVCVTGTEEQRELAQVVIKRAVAMSQWGASDLRLKQLFDARQNLIAKSGIVLRLSPMTGRLPTFETMLSSAKSRIRIGKDKEKSDLCLDKAREELKSISRDHCVLEYDHRKGGVYVLDVSTNGTYLNGKRLPAKKRIFVCHGDEICFKNAEVGGGGRDSEFGYVVNLVPT
eukprot:g5160.t1